MGKLKYKDFKDGYPELHGYFRFLTIEEIERANLEIYEILAKACDHVATAKFIYHIKEAIQDDFVMRKRSRIAYDACMGDEEAKKKKRLLDAAEDGEKNPFPWRPDKTPEFNVLMREYAYIILELQKIRTKIEE